MKELHGLVVFITPAIKYAKLSTLRTGGVERRFNNGQSEGGSDNRTEIIVLYFMENFYPLFGSLSPLNCACLSVHDHNYPI
jgi:hypothetical protein